MLLHGQQAAEISREAGIASLKHTQGDVLRALHNELASWRLDTGLLDHVVWEYAAFRRAIKLIANGRTTFSKTLKPCIDPSLAFLASAHLSFFEHQSSITSGVYLLTVANVVCAGSCCKSAMATWPLRAAARQARAVAAALRPWMSTRTAAGAGSRAPGTTPAMVSAPPRARWKERSQTRRQLLRPRLLQVQRSRFRGMHADAQHRMVQHCADTCMYSSNGDQLQRLCGGCPINHVYRCRTLSQRRVDDSVQASVPQPAEEDGPLARPLRGWRRCSTIHIWQFTRTQGVADARAGSCCQIEVNAVVGSACQRLSAGMLLRSDVR